MPPSVDNPETEGPQSGPNDMHTLARGRYFGAVAARQHCCAGMVSEVVHRRGRTLHQHAHRQAYFCLLLEGDYEEQLGSQQWGYRPFETGYHPAAFDHRDRIGDAGARFLCMEIDSAAAAAVDLRLSPTAQPLQANVSAHLLRAYSRWLGGAISEAELEGIIWELCGAMSSQRQVTERGAPRWLQQALNLVAQEYSEPLTVMAVAERVGVHPVHLSREFRRRFRRTLGEILMQVRTQRACGLLARDQQSLAEIAMLTGFADQSHFCRVFKAHVGDTPALFRQRNVKRRFAHLARCP